MSNLENLTRSIQSYIDNKSYNSVIFEVTNKEDLYTNETLKPYISNGIKCFVKNESMYYKYLDGVWFPDKPYIKSENAPEDKTLIWIPTSKYINPIEDVTIGTLLETIKTLISRMDYLEARIEVLETTGGGGGSGSIDTDIINNALLLQDGTPLLLQDGDLLLLNGNFTNETIIKNALLLQNGDALLLQDESPLLLNI